MPLYEIWHLRGKQENKVQPVIIFQRDCYKITSKLPRPLGRG